MTRNLSTPLSERNRGDGLPQTRPPRTDTYPADGSTGFRPGNALEELRDLSSRCARTGDIDRIMFLTGKRARRILQVESVSILLPDRERNELFFRLVHGPEEEISRRILKTRFPSSLGLAGHVLDTGLPLRINRVQEDSRFYSGVDKRSGFVTRNIIYAPLFAGNRVQGILGAANKLGGRFTEDDRNMAVLLANFMALYLENSRIRSFEADARTDALTGLPNRRHLDDKLKEEFHRSKRIGHGYAVIFIDLDGLKAVNDGSGHQAGDRVLANLAEAIRKEIRVTDTAGRYGGDEFVILLPEADAAEAATLAARIRAALLRLNFPEAPAGIRASFGIAACSPNEPVGHESDLVRRADLAMFLAKKAGGNRIIEYFHPRQG